ncbi:N-acetyltransferase [Pseudomonas sp. MN1F]|nr:N-acetyltransferase [Pseudomonas sp. MN1F]
MRRRHNDLRYQVFRSQARTLTCECVSQNGFLREGLEADRVRMEPITSEAIATCLGWGEEASAFPWEEVCTWKASDLRGFDLSIWYGADLCGLCYASPRKSRLRIKVILLESNPDKSHPLKGEVASLALTAIDFYARMLGCREIEIQDPVTAARALYEALGFSSTADGRLVIRVEP